MDGWGRRVRLVGCALAVGSTLAVAIGSPASAKPKSKPTVILVKQERSGIGPGETAVVDAKCPEGFAVFGGSYIMRNSVFAHAAGAAPFFDKGFYRVIVVNPPTGAFIRAQDVSVTVAAQCGETAKPLVVDGRFPSSLPKTNPGFVGTVSSDVASGTIPNGDVKKVDSRCTSKKQSVFAGGYTIDGDLFASAASAAALSKVSAFSTTVINPKFNPALGVGRSAATARVAALCSGSGDEVVLNPGNTYDYAAGKRPKRPPRGRATVIIKESTSKPIRSGEVGNALAECPRGYSVFGGSYLIGGNSLLAHVSISAVASADNDYTAELVNPPANINTGVPRTSATITAVAQCAKSGRPIVIDGPFGRG